MAGRKRKPDNLKVIQGTARPCRMNPDKPDQSPDEPRPPPWLEKDAVHWFQIILGRLDEIGLSSATFTETIGMAASRILEIEKANADIEQYGRVYESYNERTGINTVRANPAVAQRSEAYRHLQSLLAECGLTPAAISKVSTPGKNKKGNPFEGL